MRVREQKETVILSPGVQEDVLLKLLDYEIMFQWEMVREGFILFIVASYSIYYIFLK